MYRFRVYAPDADASVSVESSAAPVESAGAAAPAVETPVAAEPAPEWDGAWDKLDTQPWWKSVPEGARKHFSSLKERRDYLDELFSADDATAPLTKEVSTLKESLSAKDAEIGEWKSKHDTLASQLEEIETTRIIETIQQKWPDIAADYTYDEATGKADGAYVDFLKLVNSGVDTEKAAKMVRATMEPKAEAAPAVAAPAEPEKPARDTTLPKSVAAMSAGNLSAANATTKPPTGSWDDAFKAALKKAQAEDGDE